MRLSGRSTGNRAGRGCRDRAFSQNAAAAVAARRRLMAHDGCLAQRVCAATQGRGDRCCGVGDAAAGTVGAGVRSAPWAAEPLALKSVLADRDRQWERVPQSGGRLRSRDDWGCRRLDGRMRHSNFWPAAMG